MCRKRIVCRSVGFLCCAACAAPAQSPIPAHPSQIQFPELHYRLPPPAQFKEVLSNGMVVFIAEDRILPTFDLTVTIRTGAAVEPSAKAGLAALTGEQMRDGGTKDRTPEDLDERVEFLAASLTTGIGETRGRARLSCLSKDIDEGLGLLIEVLRYPRFDEGRFRLAKERHLQNIKRRNDSTDSIARIEWGFLLNGAGHYSNRYPSSKSLGEVTREDLFEFHRKYVHPGNMIIAVAGDFEREVMMAKLERAFADWPGGETGPTTFPAPKHAPKPGIYVIHKDDVNQGRVAIGHKAVVRGSPDEFALRVMNGILGASGFRSRLVARVRSDEGLAYNTGSRFGQGVYYPGDFQAWFQSKSGSCAFATRIVIEEIKRLRSEEVSQEDVDATISYYVESFPQRFQSKMALLSAYVDDTYTGRDADYWPTYVEKLKRVSPQDVHRVARDYLHPDDLVILAVGDAKAMILGGHDKAPELTLNSFGKVTRLPLRNPDTLAR